MIKRELQNDPRGFLVAADKMIIDEVQRAPELFSYLQTITDEKGTAGQFIISGSQRFLLNERISQSLAGRVAILHLLPLRFSELLAELVKTRFHKGLRNNYFFWRDHKGSEIDCIIDKGDLLIPIEIKASVTFSMSYFKNLTAWKKLSGATSGNPIVLYGGDTNLDTIEGRLIGWQNMARLVENSQTIS